MNILTLKASNFRGAGSDGDVKSLDLAVKLCFLERWSHGLVVPFAPTDLLVLVNTINAIKLTQTI